MIHRRREREQRAPLGAAALLVLALAGCDPDRGAVREWTPEDHGGEQGPARGQERVPTSKEDRASALAADVWRKNCATCHGPNGRGDGPQGPMVGAKDLTRAEWLSSVSDEQLAESIRKGKNRMPGFPDLPQSVVDGLIARIRAQGAAQAPE